MIENPIGDGLIIRSEDPQYRIKSAMILFALEQALGSFVVQAVPQPDSISPNIRSEIEKRIQGTGFVPVAQIVQETYIKEIIDLAVNASQDRSESEALTRLRKLVEALDVFEIRNAVCHPNRSFPECYWHRMAALATDPCIEQLRLLRVTDAFRCAMEGRITPPPDGWLELKSWSIPNNLPSTFDHQVTGLVARQEEAKDFRKRLQNARNSLVAIVGPGGTGKTALCLEVLRSCLLDPTTSQWADQLVYVSAKTERLTARGVEAISDPLTSLTSVKDAITTAICERDDLQGNDNDDDSSDFESVATEMAARRFLLCIDNLETLIRDHPQEFDDFVQSLPPAWRIVVTSRVTVNGANVLTLGPIRREGAMKLTRDYSSLRGVGRLDENQVSRLVDVCDRNPLAIRLAIDSFAAGSELSKALEQTRDRITNFAYTTLIDQLHPNATKVLECLFGSNNALSRSQIGPLLDLSPDDVAEAVNSLLRTSLVTREVHGNSERYTLSSSVRELLLRTPRDARVRDEVYSRLREQQRVIADLERSGIKDPLNESFVPVGDHAHIRALVAKVRRGVMGYSSTTKQIEDLVEVRKAIQFDSSRAVLHRTEALILKQLKDRYGAIECFGRAVVCDENDPCSQLNLAELLRDEQRLEEAKELTKPLIEAGYLTRAEVSLWNRGRLLRAYWVSTLWLGQYEEVIDATNEWHQNSDLRPSFVALRVSALQRYIDDRPLPSTKQDELIFHMLECLGEGFRLDGYVPEVVHEGFRAFERLMRMHSRAMLSASGAYKCAQFLDTHLPSMCASSNEYSLSDEFIVNLVERFRAIGSADVNPLLNDRWSDLVRSGRYEEDTALAGAGYVEARITRVFPENGYAFAQAVDGTLDFYVHYTHTEMNKNEFAQLRQGQLLFVLPSEEPQAMWRARSVRHAML